MPPKVPVELQGPNGFKNFLWLAWNAIGLPDPTPVQYDIADWMSNGPDRQVTMAFRGIGKSYIASAYVVYLLLLDPAMNIMVVSGAKNRSDDFTTFTLRLLEALGDLTAHLMPKSNQRCSKIAFDVGPAPISHAPSVTSKGIFSQITGTRADIIIADDVVTSQNSMTQVMRDKISEATKEFNAILKPEGRILYLGTPQSEQDLLHELGERGYYTRIWPAEIPPERLVRTQGDKLAPFIRTLVDSGEPVGTPTDPLRFDEEDLAERKVGYGRSGYAMQFLLDQSLSDLERYPLKINDLVVTDLDPSTCYQRYIWTNDPGSRWNRDLICCGFDGDHFHRPMDTEGDRVKYQGKIMFVDPSGRGKDETAWAVVGAYAGQLFVLQAKGVQGGYGETVLQEIAKDAKKFGVNRILVEENFGQGMMSALLKPVLISEGHPCTIEDVRSNIQKERRICDVLEPVMNSHKLILDRSVVENDWESAKTYRNEEQNHYRLVYQMSRMTREKGALRHDDRLDALAGAVEFWVKAMAQDTESVMKRIEQKKRDAQIARYASKMFGGPKVPSGGPRWIPGR